jgi:glycosyltransferase involved in cell wall biosynthesis
VPTGAKERLMRERALPDLPSPPPDRSGWPWAGPAGTVPETCLDGRLLPRVSVVTPSFNQVAFLEEAIRSVLLQDYPNLEYLVIDGGSTDGSADLILRYAPWLAYWVSEPDRGQSEAINQGWRRVTGEIVAYLNSDDTYLAPDVLSRVVGEFLAHPEAGLVHGDCVVLNEGGAAIDVWRSRPAQFRDLLFHNHVLQPAAFLRRDVLERVGLLDESLQFTMDVEYWLRVTAEFPARYLPGALAGYRLHGGSKSMASFRRFVAERERIQARYLERARLPVRHHGRYFAGLYLQEADTALHRGDRAFAIALTLKAFRAFPPIALHTDALKLLLKLLIGMRLTRRARGLLARRKLSVLAETHPGQTGA